MKKLTHGANMMLLLMGFRAIVDIFEDNYITTMLSRLTGGNISTITFYYMIKYLFTGVGAILIGKLVKQKYLTTLRIGIVADLIFFVALIKIRDSFISIGITAMLHGLALILYYLPIGFANANWIKENERHSYSSVKGIMNQILGILIPITFGGIISKTSYTHTGSILIAVVILQLIATIYVKDDVSSEPSIFRLIPFIKKIWQSSEMRIFMLMTLFRGIALMGAQKQLINMLIFENYGSEFQLGKITSIIAILTITLFWLFGRFSSEKHYRKILIFGTTIQLIAVIALMIRTNSMTITIINFTFTAVFGIMSSIIENYTYNKYVNKYQESKPEFLVSYEIIINFGRIISWLFVIVSSIWSVSAISASIGIINVLFVIMSFILAKMLKKSY